ncbi:hypothetical protein HNR46_001896 [Haloferula luteola]|uniref:Uncharacterized protein n=1 Tax=Haloferula luteola TaxID=595692 RepID=A0A840UZW9_9BACT|nr:hypothetical protein [Haloferula luteola]MBB5351657.1 hypothetical protein [Haloferula luteola]
MAERLEVGTIPEAEPMDLDVLLGEGNSERYAKLAFGLPHAGPVELQTLWNAWKDDRFMASCRRLVLARWVEVDVESARAAAGDDPDFWAAWIAFDPQKAYAEGRKSSNAAVPSRVRKLLVASHPELAEKLIEAHGSQIVAREKVPVYVSQGRFREAMEVARRGGAGVSERELFEDWFKVDPEAAFDWAGKTGFTVGRSGGDDEKRMLEWVRPHAEKVGALLDRLPAGEFRQRVEAGLVTALAEKDPSAAVDFARRMPSKRSQRNALASAGIGLAKSQPDGALSLYTELVAGGARRGEVTLLVLFGEEEGMTRRDNPFDAFDDAMFEGLPQRTFEAVLAMDASLEREETTERFASRWISKDRWGFSKWLASQSPSSSRDQLVEMLVQSVLWESQPHFEEAAQWIEAIGDAEKANTGAQRLVEGWQKADPEGLQNFLESGEAPQVVVEIINAEH